MKILMLTDLPGEYSPSAWVDCYQMRPYLEKQGYRVDIWSATNSSLYDRIVRRAKFRGRSLLYWYALALPSRLLHIIRSHKYDVVVVHRSLLRQQSHPYLEYLLSRVHLRVIYHFDDALHLAGQPGNSDRIRMAKAVWTGSEPLAQYAARHNPDVFFLEEAVDVHHYLPKSEYKSDMVTLVWTGSPYGSKELPMLEEPLSRLARTRQFQVKIICRQPYRFSEPGIPAMWVPWVQEDEPEELRESDIGLMPLQDTPYARCKQNYKVKVFMSCGLPSVCSPVGVNNILVRDGETGFLVSTADQWIAKLKLLIDDVQLRTRMGKRARQIAEERYAIEVIGPQMEAMFRQVCEL